jgi:hypothetical protein
MIEIEESALKLYGRLDSGLWILQAFPLSLWFLLFAQAFQ